MLRVLRGARGGEPWNLVDRGLAYLIAAFIKTVMSRSFNEVRSMLPRDCYLAVVIYGFAATVLTLSPVRQLENYMRKVLSL